MARYSYIAKSEPSKATQGYIEADSVQDAIFKLGKLGYFPVSVEAEKALLGSKGLWSLPRVRNKDIVIFTSQLATLVGSGVNIIKSLSLVIDQVSNKYFKVVLLDVADKVKSGKPLSESLSTHPDIFSPLHISLIRSGEASGNIEEALKRLSGYLQNEEEFKDNLRQAMIYPAFICVVSVLTILVLLGFVIPRLANMFSDMNQILPLPTKILISLSAVLHSYWWLVFVLFFMIIFMWQRMKHNQQGKFMLDTFSLKIPFLGSLILKSEIGRFMRTMSLLISGGMPITSALEVANATLDNRLLRQVAGKFKQEISSGIMLSEALRNSKLFPEFTINIISVGEETGSLPKSFTRIAQDYEREVDITLKSIARLIEPVIILVMGLIVCFIVLSMLLPIFQINLIVR